MLITGQKNLKSVEQSNETNKKKQKKLNQQNNNRQEKIVKFIIDYSEKNGYPPTMREVANEIDVSSSSTIHKILHACQEDGLIVITKGILRSMKVTPKGKELISA